MIITNKEFDEVIKRENSDGCLRIRHYIVNNGTTYAEIEAVNDEQAGKYRSCPACLQDKEVQNAAVG